MNTIRGHLFLKASLIFVSLAFHSFTQAHTEQFSTGFEFDDSGTFSIGSSPITATFAGGRAQRIGVGAYYHGGTHSWHVPSGGLATVTFETPADGLDFWFRDTAGASSSAYSIINTEGGVIGSGSGTQSFVHVVLFPGPGEPRIASVEFDSAGGGDTVVDDFSFQATDAEPGSDFVVNLEEPVNGEIHSGIGNLRGWAVAVDGIERIEIDIDGEYAFDAPSGGERTDVGGQFPEIEGAANSGFSLAYGYANLAVGEHTITARAITTLGEMKESSSTFTVLAFHKNFIPSTDVVDVTGSDITKEGDELLIENVLVDGQLYDLKLKWRTAEQGFEIIEIE